MMSCRKILGCLNVMAVAFCISLSSTAQAVSVASSIMDDNGEWTLETTQLEFIPAGEGITPTAGVETMHFNNSFAGQFAGTNFVVFPTALEVGIYTATIDVSNYNNTGLATIGDVGMTVGGTQPGTVGTLLAPDASSTPLPALGATEQWLFTYDILPGNPNLGSSIGFAITVPFISGSVTANVGFDNLNIDLEQQIVSPGGVPEPLTASLGVMSLGALAIKLRRRAA